MGIVWAIVLYIINYINAFKSEFDDEVIKKLGGTMFGLAVIVVVISLMFGIIGR